MTLVVQVSTKRETGHRSQPRFEATVPLILNAITFDMHVLIFGRAPVWQGWEFMEYKYALLPRMILFFCAAVFPVDCSF